MVCVLILTHCTKSIQSVKITIPNKLIETCAEIVDLEPDKIATGIAINTRNHAICIEKHNALTQWIISVPVIDVQN